MEWRCIACRCLHEVASEKLLGFQLSLNQVLEAVVSLTREHRLIPCTRDHSKQTSVMHLDPSLGQPR